MEQRRGMAAQRLEQAQGRHVVDQLVRVVDHEHEVAAQPSRDLSGDHLGHRVGLGLPVWVCVRTERERRRPDDTGREAWESEPERGEQAASEPERVPVRSGRGVPDRSAVRPLGEQHALAVAGTRDDRREAP